MASDADRMIDEAEGRSPKAPPPAQREVGGYESLSQAERQRLAQTVAANMGGKGTDVARVLDAMNTNPNFALQQLQRHGSQIGLGLNEANRMSVEREGMDYVNPASLQAQTQAAPAPTQKRQAAPAAKPTGPMAAAGAEAAPTQGGGGPSPWLIAPLALAGLRKAAQEQMGAGVPPEKLAQDMASKGMPPAVIKQVLEGEVMPPERGVGGPPSGLIEGQVVDGSVNRQGLPAPQGKLPPPALDDTGGAGQPPAPAPDDGGKPAPKAASPKKQSKEDSVVEEATKADTVEGKASSKAEAGPKKPKQPKSKNELITNKEAIRRQSEDAWIKGGDIPPYLKRVIR